MEDYREDIVIILAGYTKEMHSFFEMNSGLVSRFPTSIEFPDYSSKELVDIIRQMYQYNNYILGEEAEKNYTGFLVKPRQNHILEMEDMHVIYMKNQFVINLSV